MLGGFGLRPAMVINQAYHFTLLDREPFHGLMKGAPLLQLVGILNRGREIRRGHPRRDPVRTGQLAGPADAPGVVAPDQVEQLAAHLLSGQPEEAAYRGGLYVAQGAQQPQEER